MTYSEDPNENQSSFGPSNQNSTFEQDKPVENGWGSGNSGWSSGSGTPQQTPQTQPLPWQQNDMAQNQSISAPSSPPSQLQNPYSPQQPQQSQWQQQDVGHEGTTAGGMNRNQYRDAWMQSGISNPQQMNSWLQQHGGQMLNDSGVVRTPFGEILDMGIAYKTGRGTPGWTDIGMNQMPQGNFGMGNFGPSQGGNPYQMQGTGGGMPPQQPAPINPYMYMGSQQQPGMQYPHVLPSRSYDFSNVNQPTNINNSFSAPSGQLGQSPYLPPTGGISGGMIGGGMIGGMNGSSGINEFYPGAPRNPNAQY